MRPQRFYAFTVSACAATLLSCGGGGENNFTFDASVDALAVDAAGIVDAEMPVDAALQPVQVTVLQSTGPAVGATVVFARADDSVITVETTGPDGVASAVVPDGSTVTAIYQPLIEDGPTWVVGSIVSVSAGERLTFGEVVPSGTFDQEVNIPASTGAREYSVRTLCGDTLSTPLPTKVKLSQGCTSTPLWVHASGTQGNRYLYLPAVSVPSQTPIDLTGRVYKPSVNTEFRFTNPPPVVEFYLASGAPVDGKFGLPVAITSFNPVVPSAGTTVVRQLIANEPSLDLFVSLRVRRDLYADQNFYQRVPAGVAQTLDVNANTLPWVNSIPQFDPSRTKILWTQVPGAKQPDLQSASYGVGRSQFSFVRYVHAPPTAGATAGEVRIPQLQGAESMWNLTPQDQPQINGLSMWSMTGGATAYRALLASGYPGYLPKQPGLIVTSVYRFAILQ